MKLKDKFCIIKEGETDPIDGGCHTDRESANQHVKALYSAEAEMAAEEVLSGLDEEDNYLAGDNYVFAEGMKEYPWEGPICFEGVTTGDNRVFKSDSINWQDETLPWAFRWQKASGQGHAGSVPVGRVDRIERMEDGSIHGYGVVIPDLSDEAAQYLKLLESGVGGGVSVDGDSAQFEIQEQEGANQPRVEFSSMRLRALSAVDIPAFNGARVHLIGSEPEATSTEELEIIDTNDEIDLREELAKKKAKKASYGWQIEDTIIAAAIPTMPSTIAFIEPEFDGPTALTVTTDGKVFGHLALFNTCHIGFPGTCVKPPKGSTYQYFHTGQIETVEGDLVDVGRITFKTGHADMSVNPRIAADHYDNTGTVAADVRAGEDQFGIWVVGALRPHLTDEDIRAFRAAPLSGDWRRIAGKLELVGALGVNTPGFPVPRVKALVASGETETLFTYPESNEDLYSEYELNLRQSKKLELSSQVGPYYSAYELDLRHYKKDRLSFAVAGAMDKVSPFEGRIEEDLPKPLTKKEMEAKVKSYSKAEIMSDLQQLKELLADPEVDMSKKVRDGLDQLYQTYTLAIQQGAKFAVDGFDLDIITASGLEPEEWQAQLELSGLDIVEFYNICHDKEGRFCEGNDGPGRSRDKIVSGRHDDPIDPNTGAVDPTNLHGTHPTNPGQHYHIKPYLKTGQKPGQQQGNKKGKGNQQQQQQQQKQQTTQLPNVNHKTYENYRSKRASSARWGIAATLSLAAIHSPFASLLQVVAKSAGFAALGSPAILGLILAGSSIQAGRDYFAARQHRADYNHQVDHRLRAEKAFKAAEEQKKRAVQGP